VAGAEVLGQERALGAQAVQVDGRARWTEGVARVLVLEREHDDVVEVRDPLEPDVGGGALRAGRGEYQQENSGGDRAARHVPSA